MMIFHSASNTSYFFIDEVFGIVETAFFKTAFLMAVLIFGIVFSLIVMKQEKGESPMTQENYLSRKNQLMRTFAKLLARAKPSVVSWLSEEPACRFMRESRQEYEALIPRIPYIGNSNIYLSFFFPSSRYLAVYRALQRQGRTIEDAGRLVFMIGTEEARTIPPIARRFMEYL
jgi:hypothetical protein